MKKVKGLLVKSFIIMAAFGYTFIVIPALFSAKSNLSVFLGVLSVIFISLYIITRLKKLVTIEVEASKTKE